jgi:hypothetical protein
MSAIARRAELSFGGQLGFGLHVMVTGSGAGDGIAISILFAGVNTDQCVLHSLTDANFLGYGCILVEDCCATTSSDFCTEATVWNVKKCFGFVTGSEALIKAVSSVVWR